jgi:hypothetical protein
MNSETAAYWQVVLGAINVVILLATLVVLGFYTYYTYYMQQAVTNQSADLARQVRLGLMPAFSASMMNPTSPMHLKLSNIGNGVALNVEIDPVHIKDGKYAGSRLEFQRITTFPVGDTKAPSWSSDYGDPNLEPSEDMQRHIGLLHLINDKKVELNIKFQDIEGTHYRQRIQMLFEGSKPFPVEIDG